MRSFSTVAIILMLALGAGACGSNTPTTPTTPTPVTTTETFTGALNVNGAVTHPFFTTSLGTVTAKMTAIDPAESLTIGLSLGTWNGISCHVIIATDQAILATTVTGTVSTTSGSLCVRVYDTGGLVGPTNYEVQVVHP